MRDRSCGRFVGNECVNVWSCGKCRCDVSCGSCTSTRDKRNTYIDNDSYHFNVVPDCVDGIYAKERVRMWMQNTHTHTHTHTLLEHERCCHFWCASSPQHLNRCRHPQIIRLGGTLRSTSLNERTEIVGATVEIGSSHLPFLLMRAPLTLVV